MKAREEILEAADQLFGRVGFDAASTREIAELSGVNKALIHYHFKSKQALFENVLDRYYERLNEALFNALSQEAPLRERMGKTLNAYMDFLAENVNFSRIVQRESAGGPHLERIASHLKPLFQAGVILIERDAATGRPAELSAFQLMISFYGMAVGYFTYSDILKRLSDTNPLGADQLQARKKHLQKMLDIVIDQIEAGPATKSGPKALSSVGARPSRAIKGKRTRRGKA